MITLKIQQSFPIWNNLYVNNDFKIVNKIEIYFFTNVPKVKEGYNSDDISYLFWIFMLILGGKELYKI